ncbi:LytR/AlgR family response regulator transcription factor [Psychroserpens sp. MEBiC05023]
MKYLNLKIPILTLNLCSEKNSKIKCIIIDDDPFIQDLLKDKLECHFNDLKIIAIANSGKEGLAKIKNLKPDLIFLDVEMIDMTGFEMLSKLSKVNFKTIFITSYKHYAIKAIRFNALDYLLKPFDIDELKNALKRFKKIDNRNNLNLAISNYKTKDVSLQVLTLRTQQGELQLALKNIISIEGERNYSYINLTNNKRKLVTKTLKSLEDLLRNKGFFRCHKSHIINKLHIKTLSNQYLATLSNGVKVPISRRKKEDFITWLETPLVI